MAKKNYESIGIDLIGRIRSIKLAERNMLLPLFEAIVNSIHAIEDLKIPNGQIEVQISRETELQFVEPDAILPSIEKFTIIDNGIGFNEENYESFKKAYSTHKADRGGKGLGRFIWLKAFSDVRVESVFYQDHVPYKRMFRFNLKKETGIELPNLIPLSERPLRTTSVELCGFKDPYKSKSPKKAYTIANRIIEHCLIYFLRDDCPTIIVTDGAVQINLNQKFEELSAGNSFSDILKIKGIEFRLTLLKWFEHDEFTYHKMSLCANQREVENFNLNKVFQDLHGKIEDDLTGQHYLIVGYLESAYFDKNVNEERTEIIFSKDGFFDKDLISEPELYKALEPKIKHHFESVMDAFKERKLETINVFIEEKAPQYRILSRHPGLLENLVVTENMSEQDIDLKLYKAYQDIDYNSRKEVNKILQSVVTEDENPELLRKKYLEVLHNLSELNKSKLAQYVVHRKYIIELFQKSLEFNAKGKYELEKTVHDIVFPTKMGSDEIDYNEQNLWLIDERLSFHTFLSSDKPFNTIKGLETTSTDRPDLLIFNNPFSFIEGDENPFNSVVLVEFKRPMRDSYGTENDNPIKQIYDYVRKIRNGKQLIKNGRRYPINENTWFYTYLICDVNDKIGRFAEDANLEKTFDGLGYYGYNKNLKCLIEVLTFDQVIANAKKRNKVLFHKLGI